MKCKNRLCSSYATEFENNCIMLDLSDSKNCKQRKAFNRLMNPKSKHWQFEQLKNGGGPEGTVSLDVLQNFMRQT